VVACHYSAAMRIVAHRFALMAVVAVVAVLGWSDRVLADVTATPKQITAGTSGPSFTITVSDNGTESPTQRLDIAFPTDMPLESAVASVSGPAGWTAAPMSSPNSYSISGSPKTGPLTITVSLTAAPRQAGTIAIKILQTHTDGLITRWIDDPLSTAEHRAALITVVPAGPSGPVQTPEPDSKSVIAWTPIWVRTAAGAAVVIAVGVLMLRSRRRRQRQTALTVAPGPPTQPSGPATQTPGHPAAAARMRSAETAAPAPGPRPAETAPPATQPRPAQAAPTVAEEPAPGTASAPIRLAIDYGTSNTVALLRWPDGRIRPLLFDSSPLLPSAVQDANGQLLTGSDALNAARLDPSRHERNPKRRINEISVLLGDHEHEIADLVAATLRRVVDETVRVTGTAAPAGTLLTHPAAWGTIRRSILTDAAARAGLSDAVLVPEPVAAATYYAAVLGETLNPGQSLVIFDLGAGTFDATVVRRGTDGLQILTADGIDDLGGLDFDALIVDLAGAQVGSRDGRWQRLIHPQTASDRRYAWLLWNDARTAKEALSRLSTAGLSLPSLDTETHVTREQFEVAARPLLARTLRATVAVLRDANVPADQIAGLFLVGGSTRIPLVATLLFQETGIRPTVLEQPEIVVAEGALHLVP
jgi:hypothetical protein